MNGNTKKKSPAKGGTKAAVWGLCALALVFGFALAGCDNGSDPGGGGGGGGGGDTITPDPPWTGTPVYSIGDTGPGGGKIFYVSEVGFTVYTSAVDTTGTLCHYLEAAPVDINGTKTWASPAYWGMGNWVSISGTVPYIGTGRKNTALILATDADAPAAKACNDLTTGGKTDWFLPSQYELNQLYTNRTSVSGLGTSNYWSSSQYSDSYSCSQNFSSGNQANFTKLSSYAVRAVRAF